MKPYMFMLFCTMLIDSAPPATTTSEPSTITRLRADRDRLQARSAVAVDRRSGNAHRQSGAQRGRAPEIVAARAFGQAAADDDVFDFSGIDARAFDRMMDDVSRHRGARGLIECAAKRSTDRACARPRRLPPHA